MILLVSIGFDDKTKDNLMGIMANLKKCSRKGMFLDRRNLRLNFLSMHEIDDIRPIQKAVDELTLKPFDVTFTRIDRSRREGGDIYWAVAEENPELTDIYNKLRIFADDYEYEYEETEFKARVRLGSNIIARPNFRFEKFDAAVNNITLIKCFQSHGKKIYKELYKKEF